MVFAQQAQNWTEWTESVKCSEGMQVYSTNGWEVWWLLCRMVSINLFLPEETWLEFDSVKLLKFEMSILLFQVWVQWRLNKQGHVVTDAKQPKWGTAQIIWFQSCNASSFRPAVPLQPAAMKPTAAYSLSVEMSGKISTGLRKFACKECFHRYC